jgi:hypothetical protein
VCLSSRSSTSRFNVALPESIIRPLFPRYHHFQRTALSPREPKIVA